MQPIVQGVWALVETWHIWDEDIRQVHPLRSAPELVDAVEVALLKVSGTQHRRRTTHFEPATSNGQQRSAPSQQTRSRRLRHSPGTPSHPPLCLGDWPSCSIRSYESRETTRLDERARL